MQCVLWLASTAIHVTRCVTDTNGVTFVLMPSLQGDSKTI